jgi:hypothetical protein
MSINGQPTGKTDSAYYYLLDGKSSSQTDLTSIKVSITSIGGETISDTVSLTAGSCTESKVQFSGGKETSGRFNENPPPLPPSPPTQQPSQAPATQAPVTQAPVTQAPTQTPTQAPTQPPTEAPIPSKLTPSPFKNHRNVPFANSVSGSLSTDPISPTDSNSLIEEWKSLSSSSADSDASDSVIGIDGPDENTSNSGDKSNSPSDQTNEITTQSSEKEGGTSPAIIILSCFAAVGMLVLATLGYKVHKKKLDDKRNDVDPLPFDLMRTPGDNERSDIAVL